MKSEVEYSGLSESEVLASREYSTSDFIYSIILLIPIL